MSQRISAIIHTLNEEANIANAVGSVLPWVDEVLVVDMHSDDRTAEIARSLGAKVLLHERTGFVEPARMFSEQQAASEWILLLDADELVTTELAQELRRLVDDDAADIFWVSRQNYLGGEPMFYTGWGPKQEYGVRLYRKGSLAHNIKIHGQPKFQDGARETRIEYAPQRTILHFSYLNIAHFLQKMNRYTDIEAQQAYSEGKRMRARDILILPVLEFLNRYIRRQGYRDGWLGFYYSCLLAIYRMTLSMKLRELAHAGTADDIRAKYQQIASEELSKNATHSSAGQG